jgi:hypothetical protein
MHRLPPGRATSSRDWSAPGRGRFRRSR